MFKDTVYSGNREAFNSKLKILANFAEKEKWTFAKSEMVDPYRILRNYIAFTYNRLEE